MRGAALLLLLSPALGCGAPAAESPTAQRPATKCAGPAKTRSLDWPLACASGNASACLALTMDPSTWSGDRMLARGMLREACHRDACGCLTYGTALFADEMYDVADEGWKALASACDSGVREACLRLQLETTRCARLPQDKQRDDFVCVAAPHLPPQGSADAK